MGRVIAAINMTLDGYCDHTAIDPDEEIHDHYADLLASADTILYGRKTYRLMQFWKTLVDHPSGEKSMDDFAVAMDKLPKVVFSRSILDTGWDSASLATKSLEATVKELKEQSGRDILVGSRSIIMQLLEQKLIDEFQLCIHPVVAGGGLPLFENLEDRTVMKLVTSRAFTGGAVLLCYEPNEEDSVTG